MRLVLKLSMAFMAGTTALLGVNGYFRVRREVVLFQTDRARDLCEKLLSYASPLGLYAEEIDVHSGRHLGNFPQAFTHLALINAVMHVISQEEAGA